MSARNPVENWREIAAHFFRIGATAYGGPAIMGIMQTELQAKRQWVSKEKFVEGLSLVNMLPLGIARSRLSALAGTKTLSRATRIDRWDDVPAVSEDFTRARDVIVARVTGLLEDHAIGR